MPITLSYNIKILIISIIIAYIASYAVLFLFLRFKNQSSHSWLKWFSAFIMGIAICGMHYTGMEGVEFYANTNIIEEEQSIDTFLLYGVTATIFVLLSISWSAMFFERHAFEKMAYHDALTGLPNRHEMNRCFEKLIKSKRIGVLFIDLDEFKSVNDNLGHHIGDQLLQEFSARLNSLARNGRSVFRIGGDEFLLVMKDCDKEQAEQLAEEIIQINKKVYIG